MPAFHMVELLDASMRGIPREDLMHSDNHRLTRGVNKSS